MSTHGTGSLVGTKRSAPEEQHTADAAVWQKCYSNTHKKDYWFRADTGERSWEEPPAVATTRVADHSIVTAASSSSSSFSSSFPSSLSSSFSSDSCLPPGWTKHTSTKHGREYWYHAITKETSWEPPSLVPTTSDVSAAASAAAATKKNFEALLEKEQKEAAMDRPDCPRVINSTNLPLLVQRLRKERAEKRPGTGTEFAVIFEIANDELAEYTRAIQEDQILKTRLKVRRGKDVIDLPSFWEVWDANNTFRHRIQSSSDPNEEKWKCRKDFGYKIATTFMPLYAKAVYEHFGAERVLDPCAGWGDRMVGAASSSCVKQYVSFDPNRSLRPGYARLMSYFGHSVTHLEQNTIGFSNGYFTHAEPFEVGVKRLETNSFDLVFTSPPFFDYEMYNPLNPQYHNWIDEFYRPLFIEAARCVKPGGYVCIHIGDTSAGNIEEFLQHQVHRICPLTLNHRLALKGKMSGELRTVWVFLKAKTTTATLVSVGSCDSSAGLLSPTKSISSTSGHASSVMSAPSSSHMMPSSSLPHIFLSRAQILGLSNPPIRTLTVGNKTMSFTVFDDGQCVGGTKQR